VKRDMAEVKQDRAGSGWQLPALRPVNLAFAILAALPPLAHVLELPNKLALDAPLWLAVQQHLYRGWGPFYGGPVEIIAFATTVTLLVARRRDPAPMRLTLVAALGYAGMIAAFFTFNDPVNAALNSWTPSSMPADWESYRLRWESGHALAAVLAIVAIVALVRAWFIERERLRAQ
jgi:Anthrone oxygenase